MLTCKGIGIFARQVQRASILADPEHLVVFRPFQAEQPRQAILSVAPWTTRVCAE
jgi:hypothetical protein